MAESTTKVAPPPVTHQVHIDPSVPGKLRENPTNVNDGELIQIHGAGWDIKVIITPQTHRPGGVIIHS